MTCRQRATRQKGCGHFGRRGNDDAPQCQRWLTAKKIARPRGPGDKRSGA